MFTDTEQFCVNVRFSMRLASKFYTYRLPEHIDIDLHDDVVVPLGHAFAIGVVIDVIPLEIAKKRYPGIDFKWVVQKVDYTEYDKLVQAELKRELLGEKDG